MFNKTTPPCYGIRALAAAAVAVALLSSCSVDQPVKMSGHDGISFRASVGASTKASEVNASNLTGFNVTAIGNGASYFTDMAVSVDGGTCTAAKTYYWPSYELGFYAYANVSGGTVSITNSAKTISGVTPAAAASEQTDMIVAYETGNKTDNEDAGVPLNFRHALSQVVVKAANLSTSGIQIKVAGVKLGNILDRGTFTYPAAATTTQNSGTLSQSLWNTSAAELTDYTIAKAATDSVLNATAKSIMFGGAAWMVIPQQLTARASFADGDDHGSSIGVMVQILDAGGTQLYPASGYAYTNIPIGTNWEPGKKYVYTLNFLDEAHDGGAGVDDDDDPVLGKPIKFTLTVDDWVQEPVTVTPVDPVPDPANGHAWVDLGLRSGGNKILFATMNVGASSEEEYGDYFAWGETSKRYTSISGSDIVGGTFEYSNAPYHTGDSYSTGWSKYIPTGKASYWSAGGDPDNLLTLAASDDVASVLWGGDWRMPDKAELEMLLSEAVTYAWTADYNSTGVAGLLITGKDSFSGASLFLPAAGNGGEGVCDGAGDFGYYWSRSLYSDFPHCAWCPYFDDGYYGMSYDARCNGQSVRAVRVVPE